MMTMHMACFVCIAGSLSFSSGGFGTSVPLKAIYATTGQKNVKRMTTATDGTGSYIKSYGKGLAAVQKKVAGLRSIARAIFLVTGKDIDSVMLPTAQAFETKAGMIREIRAGKAKVWMYAYFGTNGSSPPAYQVTGVVMPRPDDKRKIIRLLYKKQPALTDDIHRYMAWIPLGTLEPGHYELQLFEAGKRKVTTLQPYHVK